MILPPPCVTVGIAGCQMTFTEEWILPGHYHKGLILWSASEMVVLLEVSPISTEELKSHEGSQISRDSLVTVIRLPQALMLLMVISSLPNLLTAWYSALYCPSNHSNMNANVFKNRFKHFMRAHELMMRNISIGYAIAQENRGMASTKKRRIPAAFYRLGLLYLFLNFPNINVYIYNRSIAYLAGMKINHGKSA